MFCLYSKGCEYAIRALAEISVADTEKKFLARDICRKAGIPEAYARKTFQVLVQNGFLKAVTGPGGGYSLVRDPKKTSVLDVIEAVEGKAHFSKCALGLPSCSSQSPCSLHFTWMNLKAFMLQGLAAHTVSNLSRPAQKPAKKTRKGKLI